MALTASNVAKVQQGLSNNPQRKPFSMAIAKTLYHNRLLIEQYPNYKFNWEGAIHYLYFVISFLIVSIDIGLPF